MEISKGDGERVVVGVQRIAERESRNDKKKTEEREREGENNFTSVKN